MTRRQRTPWTPERIRAARVRGWKRYVAHFGHGWNPGCRYGRDCPIPSEQNHRDAILAGIEMDVKPRQTTLGLA